MAGPQRRVSNKKKGGRRGPKVAMANNQEANPPDIHQVLSQADAALEASNSESAMQLYTCAANLLRKKLQASTIVNSDARNEAKDSEILLLSRVLGKMAEAKVSMGDQQGGQRDFLEATNLLSNDSSSHSPIDQAQWKEARASLYLYLGQLSSSNDALEAFTKAINDLKACAALLEEATNINSSDESLQQGLIETR
jgi:hypothetical protein